MLAREIMQFRSMYFPINSTKKTNYLVIFSFLSTLIVEEHYFKKSQNVAKNILKYPKEHLWPQLSIKPKFNAGKRREVQLLGSNLKKENKKQY